MVISTDRAAAYVRARSQDFMNYTCKIERVVLASFDNTTGTAVPGSRSLIYEGVCRIWEVAGGGPILVNEEEVVMQNTQLSIPWDTATIPRRKDEVEIITSGTDTYLIGKRFSIDSVAKAGQLRATRRFAVSALQR